MKNASTLISCVGKRLDTSQLAAGAAMISFSGVFVKLAHVGPTASAFYRMLFGGLLLLAIAGLSGTHFRIGFKPLARMAACGLLFSMDLILWHRSVLYVGPGLSTILANFQVFFLAGFGVFLLKEKLLLRYLLSVPLGFFGLFLIAGGDWSALDAEYKRGVVLGLCTALTYAAYLLTFRSLRSAHPTISPFSTMAVISLCAAFFLGIEMVLESESFIIPDARSWVFLFCYGLFGQVFGWVLISRSIAQVDASRAGLILLLQPSLAFLWDILLFDRTAGIIEMAGCVLALGAIYMGSSLKRQ